MPEAIDDDHLERVLASVGRHLVVESPAVSADVVVLRTGGRRLRWAAAAVAAAIGLVVAASVLIGPVRSAVADLLGIGTTRIELVDDERAAIDGAASIVAGLTLVTVDDAGSELLRALPDTDGTTIGSPDAVASMPEGGVIFVWNESAVTLWVHASDLQTQLLSTKLVGSGAQVRAVSGLGEEALVVTNEHVLSTPHRRIAALAVVLWLDRDGIEHRLEGDIDPAALVDLARQLDGGR